MNPDRPVMAIYGGTFDPFHNGHAQLCAAVLARTEVSQLRLIPCYLPPLKATPSVPAETRAAMLEAWADTESGDRRLVLDTRELTRAGPSYTIDTVEALAAAHPEYQLVFVLGADAWNSLPRWHRADALMQNVSFWVFQRQGDALPLHHAALKYCPTVSEGLRQSSGHYWFDTSVALPLSSSAVRADIEKHYTLLPSPVADYIKQHRLYQQS